MTKPTMISLQDIYDRNLPDRDEMIWHFIDPSDFFDTLYEVVDAVPSVMWNEWLVDGGGATLAQSYKESATREQRSLVAQWKKDRNLADEILVVSGETLIDGHHRLAAMVQKKIKTVRVLDLETGVQK